ncbi:MAG TPA: hypothetical protein VIE18_07545 [Gaiellaceae bacterium]
MRRFFRKFTFVPALLVIAGFVGLVIYLSKPLESVESEATITGVVRASADLKPDAPLAYYAALYPGAARPPSEAPEFPLDDVQTDGEAFELVAEEGDGTQFWVLARVETAKIERWCKILQVPELRRRDDGSWVEAKTGKPLPPLDITVGRELPCSA